MTENKKKSGLKTRLTNLVKHTKKAAVIGAAMTTMAVGGKANAAVGSPMRHGHQPVVDVVPAPSIETPIVTPPSSVQRPIVAPTPVTPSYDYNRPQRGGYSRGHMSVPRRTVAGHGARPMFGRGSRGGMHVTLGRHSVGGGHFGGYRMKRTATGGGRHMGMPRMKRGAGHNFGPRGGGRSFGPRGSRGGFGPRGGRGRR